MSYASARRLAGTSATATITVLAAVAFVYQLPSTFFPYHGGPFYADWAALWVVYLTYALVSLPFDVWAGFVLPCRHQQYCEVLPVYLGRLARALFVQGMVMTLCALILLEGGKRWGVWGAMALLSILLVAMWRLRSSLAQVVGAAPAQVPAGRSFIAAGAWLLAGFALCASMPWCGVDTLFRLLETLLGCTLWTLLGLAVLSRLDGRAARASLYLSWASFGLLSRATPSMAGIPAQWANPGAD